VDGGGSRALARRVASLQAGFLFQFHGLQRPSGSGPDTVDSAAASGGVGAANHHVESAGVPTLAAMLLLSYRSSSKVPSHGFWAGAGFTGTLAAPDQVLTSASCENGVFGPCAATSAERILNRTPVVRAHHESPHQGVATSFGFSTIAPWAGNTGKDVRIATNSPLRSHSKDRRGADPRRRRSGRVGRTSGGRWMRKAGKTDSVCLPSLQDARVWLRSSASFGETDERRQGS
jgi:hypothetical protein